MGTVVGTTVLCRRLVVSIGLAACIVGDTMRLMPCSGRPASSTLGAVVGVWRDDTTAYTVPPACN
jgi:hypothetical protein